LDSFDKESTSLSPVNEWLERVVSEAQSRAGSPEESLAATLDVLGDRFMDHDLPDLAAFVVSSALGPSTQPPDGVTKFEEHLTGAAGAAHLQDPERLARELSLFIQGAIGATLIYDSRWAADVALGAARRLIEAARTNDN
jgi:hypothetical protein